MSNEKEKNNTQKPVNSVDTSKKPERPQLKMVTESYNPFDSLIRDEQEKNFSKEKRSNS
ncbi:hypothetical protein [Treponema denticola]|uniref:hypothetical protein n=1 Tax=Treponema denticola TaxID=158 RepID=UPI0020A2CE0F|nr:hypothetical protein [Treponema denticola]UTC83814.1 hypothetical protein HGJ18_11660 [Treponema denticola]